MTIIDFSDYGGYSSGTQGQANSNPCEVSFSPDRFFEVKGYNYPRA